MYWYSYFFSTAEMQGSRGYNSHYMWTGCPSTMLPPIANVTSSCIEVSKYCVYSFLYSWILDCKNKINFHGIDFWPFIFYALIYFWFMLVNFYFTLNELKYEYHNIFTFYAISQILSLRNKSSMSPCRIMLRY